MDYKFKKHVSFYLSAIEEFNKESAFKVSLENFPIDKCMSYVRKEKDYFLIKIFLMTLSISN